LIREEFPEVVLIESGGNLGFGRAHNLICANSCEPFVLFLNPDTVFVEPAHERMVDVMKQNSSVGLAGCRMVNLDESVQQLGFQWRSSPLTEIMFHLVVPLLPGSIIRRVFPIHDPMQDGTVEKLYGGALMARRSVLDQVGWFDDRFFMYGEDVDMSRRVRDGGHRLFYLSSARIIHLCGGSSAKAPGRFVVLMQCESISKLMEKYYGLSGRTLHRMAIILRSLIHLVLVGLARIPGGLLADRIRKRLGGSWNKHLAMLQWGLGIARARIPL
jgi:GT2 family glycosyltransferase